MTKNEMDLREERNRLISERKVSNFGRIDELNKEIYSSPLLDSPKPAKSEAPAPAPSVTAPAPSVTAPAPSVTAPAPPTGRNALYEKIAEQQRVATEKRKASYDKILADAEAAKKARKKSVNNLKLEADIQRQTRAKLIQDHPSVSTTSDSLIPSGLPSPEAPFKPQVVPRVAPIGSSSIFGQPIRKASPIVPLSPNVVPIQSSRSPSTISEKPIEASSQTLAPYSGGSRPQASYTLEGGKPLEVKVSVDGGKNVEVEKIVSAEYAKFQEQLQRSLDNFARTNKLSPSIVNTA